MQKGEKRGGKLTFNSSLLSLVYYQAILELDIIPEIDVDAHQHLFRVQVRLGNKLNPEDWGWKLIDNILEPVKTLLPRVLEKLLCFVH